MGKFYSDTLEKAIELLHFQADSDKYPEAVAWLEKAVSEDDADACYFLARCYAWGDGGVGENPKKALELHKKGIQGGSDLCILGAHQLGQFNGELKEGSAHSLGEAVDETIKGAMSGNAMAQYAAGAYLLGDIPHEEGRGGIADGPCEERQQNTGEAVKWLKAAASQGCCIAFKTLFYGFLNGENGLKQDKQAALEYAEEVKGQQDLSAYCMIIANEYKSMGEGGKYTAWLEKAAEKEGAGPEALIQLGCYYWDCEEAESKKKAFECFKKAADWGEAKAAPYLSEAFYDGKGTKTDYSQAWKWAQKALQNGEKKAAVIAGKCLLLGQGTKQGYSEAKTYLEQAIEETASGEACKLLGDMYSKGLGVDENIANAVSYYNQAIQNGYADAEEELAHFKKGIFGKWKRR